MNNHIQITFVDIQPEQQEWVIAHLAETGYDGFEEEANSLKAFIPENDFDPELLKELAFKYQLEYKTELIPEQNWNQLWESNFQPVIVDDFVAVRADFHAPVGSVKYDILITPKMSFGTGHHATTYMMMQQMRDIDFSNKTVFDFGTGTGILAILAEKLGASKIVAIDNDDWSVTNAKENLAHNHCRNIELKKAEDLRDEPSFDVILANINKHILVNNFAALVGHLKPKGILILSGLLPEDEEDIRKEARAFPTLKGEKTTFNNWISIRFSC